MSKSQRSRARSGRLQRRVRRSGLGQSGCRPHGPTTPAWYHTWHNERSSVSRPSGITPCITGVNRNHAQHTITRPRTGAPHNGLSSHARHNGRTAQRASVPRLTERASSRTGFHTTSIRRALARRSRHNRRSGSVMPLKRKRECRPCSPDAQRVAHHPPPTEIAITVDRICRSKTPRSRARSGRVHGRVGRAGQ